MPDSGANGFLRELSRLARLLSVEERLAAILFMASWFAMIVAVPSFGDTQTTQVFYFGFVFLQALTAVGLVATRVRRHRKAKQSLERGRDAAESVVDADDDQSGDSVAGVDLFLAVPMDSLEDFDGNELQNGALDRLLVALNHFVEANNIYCGCKFMTKKVDFDNPAAGYRLSNAAILSCERFMLIWPKKVPTSALFELGIARKRKIPTVIFYHEEDDLPYLLKGKKALGNSDGWPVQFHPFTDLADINSQIQEQGHDIFPQEIGT